MGTLFERQLATYSTYHRHPKNRLTHFFGIPAIVFAILVPLALWYVPLGTVSLSAAWIVAGLAAIGWIALDRGVGFAMLLVLIPMVLAANWIAYAYGAAGAWITFAALFVGGWALQILGHAAYEGRRPALLDNLFQAFIGPMFIMTEALVALGLRQDLARTTEGAMRGS
jgi:uncharacterized membrane protein YGL010W